MTTRRYFSFFSKTSSSKKTEQVRIPHNEDDEREEFSGPYTVNETSKLHRSQSGRLKVKNKQRLSIATNTYDAPEDLAQSAPVISMTKTSMGMGLTSRDLTKYESNRMSRSLQFPMNFPDPNSKDSSTLSTKSPEAECPYPESDLIDDEIF